MSGPAAAGAVPVGLACPGAGAAAGCRPAAGAGSGRLAAAARRPLVAGRTQDPVSAVGLWAPRCAVHPPAVHCGGHAGAGAAFAADRSRLGHGVPRRGRKAPDPLPDPAGGPAAGRPAAAPDPAGRPLAACRSGAVVRCPAGRQRLILAGAGGAGAAAQPKPARRTGPGAGTAGPAGCPPVWPGCWLQQPCGTG